MKWMIAALAALSVASADNVAQAHTVIFQTSALAAERLDEVVDLPGAGAYRVKFTFPDEVWANATLYYLDHWDIFRAPPPQPHHTYLEGNDGDVEYSEGGYGRSFTAAFVVPKTYREFFESNALYEEVHGLPIGTPLYYERRAEHPSLTLYADNTVGEEVNLFDYSVTVTMLSVPEPSTWALMIGGFGFAGAVLRGRKATAA